MPFSVSVLSDSRKIIGFSGTSTGSKIDVTVSNGKLIFTLTTSGGATEVQELRDTGFAGFHVPTGVTLVMDASLANEKAIFGDGTAVVKAKSAGENLSTYVLDTDQIWLTDGAAYTLNASQAVIAQLGSTGLAADLRSANANSKITVVALKSADVSEIQLDKNDTLVLGEGQIYTLTADQALIGKVGAGLVGDFSTSGPLIIRAAKDADLSGLKIKPSDKLELTAGWDYVLNSALIAVARVGSDGDLRAFGRAGAVTIKANALSGEDLSSINATGIDVYELAVGKAYTLTADQLAITRVGSAGLTGDTKGAGVVTVIVGAVNDISPLATKAGDVLLLTANAHYRLTTEQAKIAKVATLATAAAAKLGDLAAAGQITVVAGLNNPLNAPSRAEDLSVFAAAVKGVDFYDLAAGADYILTTAQAKVAKVGAGDLGNLLAAGNITLIAQTGENLSQTPIMGADEYRLTAGLAYTLTAEQALKARVLPIGNGALGNYGDLASTKATVLAGNVSDLTPIGIDALDAFLLTANKDYTLTAFQASVSRIDDGTPGALTSPVGSLAKAGRVVIKANPKGEDLAVALSKVTGYDLIELSAGGKYSLSVAQAGLAIVSAGLDNNATQPVVGDLSLAGAITLVASDLGENLSGLTVQGIKAIQLTSGKDYTLTASQALMASIGATGPLGDVTFTPVPLAAGAKTGAITVLANENNVDFTKLKTDGNDVLVLRAGNNYKLTVAQALAAKISADGALGQLAGSGLITVVADASSTDLSKLSLNSGDRIDLAGGLNYTLTTDHLPLVSMGGSNSLTKAGTVTVLASITGEDLTRISIPGIDAYVLNPAGKYTLRVDQAKTARVGASGVLGDLSTMTGEIELLVPAASTPLDLTAIVLKDSDSLQLMSGSRYILTAKQASMASVLTGNNEGARGDLSGAEHITVRPAPGNDMTVLLAGVQGVDRIELDPEAAYTLSIAQARMAGFGKSGFLGDLIHKSANSKLTLVTGDESSFYDIQIDGNDKIYLQPNKPYFLTAEQALVSYFGSINQANPLVGNLANSTGDLSVITVRAPNGADLSKLVLDGNDSLLLGMGQRYTLTSALAQRSYVMDSDDARGDLSAAGAVRILAAPAGEDLSALFVDANDTLQLTAGVNYAMTAVQAANAVMGPTGVKGKLTGAGVLTVKAGATQDISSLALDTTGLATVMDVIELEATQNYSLTTAQAGVARVASTGLQGQLQNAGNLTLMASASGEDLTLLKLTGLDANDRIVLTKAKNYTLTKEQLALSVVGSGMTGDLTSAGVITLKSAPSGVTDDLSTVSSVLGVDSVVLKTGVNTTLTDEQAMVAQLGTGKVRDLRGSEILTLKSNDRDADLAPITTDKDDWIWLKNNANYSLNSAQVPRVTFDGQTVASFAPVAGQITLKASNLGEDLSPINTAMVDVIHLTAGRHYTLTPEQAQIATLGSGLTTVQNTTVTDLSKAGVITVKAHPGGDNGLKAKLSFVSGLDVIALAEGKDYTLSASQALLARVGSATTSGALISTGVITVDDSHSAPGSAVNLGRLVLDAADVLTLGRGNYDLTALQVRKAASSLATAGTVNLWASSAGENLTGISAAALDNVYLTASRDYILGLDQVAKSKVGTTGAAGNLTKAGKVTLSLRDGESTAALTSNAAIKGVDVLQVIAKDSDTNGIRFTLSAGLSKQLQVAMDETAAPLIFLKNTSSSAAGAGNTGADSAVNASGEWSFVNSTDVFTFWNGTAAQPVTLVGLASVAADGTGVLKIEF